MAKASFFSSFSFFRSKSTRTLIAPMSEGVTGKAETEKDASLEIAKELPHPPSLRGLEFPISVVSLRDHILAKFSHEQFSQEIQGLFKEVAAFNEDLTKLTAAIAKFPDVTLKEGSTLKLLFGISSGHPNEDLQAYIKDPTNKSFSKILAKVSTEGQTGPRTWLKEITDEINSSYFSPEAPTNGYIEIPVFFRTNRTFNKVPNPISKASEDDNFLTGRSLTPKWGVTRFSVPNFENLEKAEVSSWTFDLKADRGSASNDLIVALSTRVVDDKELSAVKEGAKECIIFVHGYNNSMANAADRMAQIAYAANFQGPVFIFSWPSNCDTSEYTGDEANVMWAVPEFVRTLEHIKDELGITKVHIIAHSMGSRLSVYALLRIFPVEGFFGQVIFAAPDFDMGEFAALVDDLKKKCDRVTLYASSNDAALLASTILHGYPRLGLFSGFQIKQSANLGTVALNVEKIIEALQTKKESAQVEEANIAILRTITVIDCTNANDGTIHHSYAFDKEGLIKDLAQVINFPERKATERVGLAKLENHFYCNVKNYPEFNVDTVTKIP